jgi:hypothetical protein
LTDSLVDPLKNRDYVENEAFIVCVSDGRFKSNSKELYYTQ